eukprot:gene7625-15610_t
MIFICCLKTVIGGDECAKLEFNKKPLDTAERKRMRLWPVHDNDHSNGSESLYGFSHAMKVIWDHQHPKSCADAKFLISHGHNSGFGSILHVEGSFLAIAMNLGRILLPHPKFPSDWQFDNPFCKKHDFKNFYCYYEQYSSCTYNDAMPSYNNSDPNSWNDASIPVFDYTEEGGIDDAIKRHGDVMNSKVLRLKPGLVRSFEVPKVLTQAMKCAPIQHENGQAAPGWWLSMSAAFLLRPNPRTMHFISKLRTFHVNSDGPCIGMYVRHGDKHAEMPLVPFSKYAEVAQQMWDKGLVHKRDRSRTSVSVNGSPGRNGTIFFGTEDPVALKEAIDWAKQNGWKLLFTDFFDRGVLSAADRQRTTKEEGSKEAGYRGGHHDLEYISMLVNIDYMLKCSAWVGTMSSNWCRIIDELRMTVAGKADLSNADLNRQPPYIYTDYRLF